MISCAQCGTDNRPTAHFCLNCGAELLQAGEPLWLEAPEIEKEEQPEVEVKPDLSPPTLADTELADHIVDPLVPVDVPEQELDKSVPGAEEPGAEIGPPIREAEEPAPPPAATDEVPALEPIRESEAREPDEPNQAGPTEVEESIGEDEQPGPSNRPLEPGSLLAERYQILTLLEESPETFLYEAADRYRCTQCNYAESQPGDVYCASCGASLIDQEEPPRVLIRSLHLSGEVILQLEEENEGRVEQWLESEGRLYAVLSPPVPEPTMNEKSLWQGTRHIVGYSSDPGQERELDEDAILVLTLCPVLEGSSRPSLGLYIVADGMGGHAGGEVASRQAVRSMADILTRRLLLPELLGETILPDTPAEMLNEAVKTVNHQIFELQLSTGSDMGTTITAALVRDETALIANVGDSRTYLWRGGELRQLTTDHSLVAQLVEAGAIEPHEIYTHRDRHAIYRSLGHAPEVEVDVFEQQLEPGDRLLLCCDGAWEMLRDDGIEEVLLLEPEPQTACDEIIRRANLAGGEDNISAVIVQFEPLGAT